MFARCRSTCCRPLTLPGNRLTLSSTNKTDMHNIDLGIFIRIHSERQTMPTVISAPKKSKGFSFSYSKLKNYEICPRRYHEIDVKKAWPEERSEQLSWGDRVHEEMATALRNDTELPAEYAGYQPWIDKVNRTPGELLVECKWAITREFQPTAWFSPTAWLRSVADAVKINDMTALVVDWKTGKSLNVDEMQLTLTALVVFIHFPKVLRVRADFIWLPEDSQTTLVIDRSEAADQWAELMPRIKSLQKAVEDEHFPPKPNRFCQSWCPVRTCEYWGTNQ